MSAPRLALADAAATEALGAALARTLPAAAAAARPGVVYLRGELGAGKTTLARGFLHALGVTGTIRSPSYTLVESYGTPAGDIWHADLYRLTAPGEIEALGLQDLSGVAVLLVEWPERGQPGLAPADLTLVLHHSGEQRMAELAAGSDSGRRWLAALQQRLPFT